MHPSRTGRWAAICALTALVFTSTPGHRPSAGELAPHPVATPDRSIRAAPPPPIAPDLPAGRRQILVPHHNPIELYPPTGASPTAPLTVMLHGMCSGPVDVCDDWSDDGRAGSWLACPAGNVRCGDAFDWGGPTESRVAAVGAQLEAVEEAYGAPRLTLGAHAVGPLAPTHARCILPASSTRTTWSKRGVLQAAVFMALGGKTS